jgi:cytochrome bd-type quinol oxidase subunit 2
MVVVAAVGIPVVGACAWFAYRVFRGRVGKTGEGY